MITRTNSHSHSRSIEPEPEPELELELEPEPEPSSSSNTNNNNYSSSSSSPDLLSFPSPTTLLSSPTRFATSSSMLRPRPRLPAGPRTRKQTTLLGSSSSSSSKDQDPSFQHHPSLHSSDPAPAWTAPGSGVQLTDPFSPSPQSLLPPLSTTLPAQPSINQQTELPIPIPDRSLPSHPPPSSSSYSYSTTPLSPHDPPQTTSSPSQDQLPLDPQHVSIQLTPDTSRAGTPTLPLTLSTSLMSPAPPRKPSQATISSISPPINPPPAQLDITPEPLPYKHLTLDAAHWALTSTELQSLVSSAIRESAKEQFIRLLPPSDIDSRLPEDSARIERSWDTASARWRFEAHRRNMLLRALAASGADGELLTQLSNTLCNIDTHAKDLLHASIHRNQLAAARDTHRASALAVALRKLNASYARRTRDLDKARAQIATLRSEVDEAWNAAHKEATEVDRLKTAAATKQREAVTDNITPTNAATTTATTTTTTTTTGGTEDPTDITDDDNAYEDDTSGSALPDGASVDLTTVSRAEVIDVMGKAIAAQARFTMMRTDHPSGSRPPPSAFGRRRSQSSPVTSRSNTPHRQLSIASQVSRASAARRRSIRKNKAGLRLPTSVRARSSSRSVVRGESGSSSNHKAQSKNRNKMGNESVRAEPPIPWLPMDAVGSFLEMEGRPTGEEDGDGDGDGDGDDNVEGDEEGEEEEEEGEGEKEKGEESRSVDISRAGA
ncbi:hypothetical protein B0F90DRAFT_1142222 [Multifurca ochricompacta]|uniref:Uncharacterized protein n=1 Tax=Multifurca ochricompacta TaxID=376703 RepID=A0AAD4LYY3_9AGAM|nr:hypothetical protein B0F90DRAFT_1142222 [Multifurca ochricompacta]